MPEKDYARTLQFMLEREEYYLSHEPSNKHQVDKVEALKWAIERIKELEQICLRYIDRSVKPAMEQARIAREESVSPARKREE